MARVIEEDDLVGRNAEVYNVSGAGGTIGLAQLAAKRKGEANQMMVMGLVMLGAIETNQAPLDVDDTTPIAALTSEPEAIVVRSESDIRDLGTDCSWASWSGWWPSIPRASGSSAS
jgi:putative tricarboxylic transport membrane protein